MPIDETVRRYQTSGATPTHKTDKEPEGHKPSQSVSVQYNDVVKKELTHGDCPGCNY